MDLYLDVEFRQDMEQRPSPTLVTFTQLLALSSQELQYAIQQEIAENPALDLLDTDDHCVRCGEALIGPACPRCDGLGDEDWQPESAVREYDDDFDPFNFTAAQITLEESLMGELRAALPAEDHFIADYLCGSLDDTGFLATTVEEVARTLGVDAGRVEAVLKTLQRVGPLGAGARDVRECLDIQLSRWEELGAAHPLARAIVERYLQALGEGKYGYIANQLGVGYDEVVAARDFIRNHLRPFPIPDLVEAEPWRSVTETPFIAPDIVINERADEPGEFDVEVVESRRFGLRINPMYQRLAEGMFNKSDDLSSDDRDHVASFVGRARAFTGHINERRRTMKRVAVYVVERQKEFLRHGWRELRPLTRAEVADALDLHESTVSRATAEKYVMLPWGQVIPFAKFFQAALSVQDVLREIISQEVEPLTDAQLVDKLSERGYQVARRTVAKYRNQMRILPSSLR
ncbi:MAG TPA: hypothetical protein VER55_06810 [Ardenticatenaceae bacterium]|nr:hypothetical protein [Ardenticatenaceae bacterium]